MKGGLIVAGLLALAIGGAIAGHDDAPSSDPTEGGLWTFPTTTTSAPAAPAGTPEGQPGEGSVVIHLPDNPLLPAPANPSGLSGIVRDLQRCEHPQRAEDGSTVPPGYYCAPTAVPSGRTP